MEEHNRSSLAASDDMISSLPDDLLSRILSLLPTRRAVATSVLSKRWRFAWTGVTSFMFYDHPCCAAEDPTMSFGQFVNMVLNHHHCSYLNRFEVISEHRFSEQIDLNRCFTYAISRNVGAINFQTPTYGHIIPCALFTCATLESLELRGPFMVQALPGVVSLPRLQVMTLSGLRFESEDSVEKLISSCSVLHKLLVQFRSKGHHTVSSSSLRRLLLDSSSSHVLIDAPNLEKLYIYNRQWTGFGSITIKRLAFSSSVKLALLRKDLGDDVFYDYRRCYKCIVQLAESVSQYVGHLTLNGFVMKALTHSTTPLSACFPCLTRLDIRAPVRDWNTLCVSVMLVKSIRLQSLSVTLGSSTGYKSRNKCWEDPKQIPECLSSSLKWISFEGFRGLEDEMAMLKYVLSHGAVLEDVSISSDYYSKCRMQLNQVSMFPRLSPSCQLHL